MPDDARPPIAPPNLAEPEIHGTAAAGAQDAQEAFSAAGVAAGSDHAHGRRGLRADDPLAVARYVERARAGDEPPEAVAAAAFFRAYIAGDAGDFAEFVVGDSGK